MITFLAFLGPLLPVCGRSESKRRLESIGRCNRPNRTVQNLAITTFCYAERPCHCFNTTLTIESKRERESGKDTVTKVAKNMKQNVTIEEEDAVRKLVSMKEVNENEYFDASSLPGLEETLRFHWKCAVAESDTPPNPLFDAWFYRIYEQHNEPGRYYHTAVHLKEMLAYLQILRDTNVISHQQWVPMVWATFFHDVVYDPKSSKNECDSAALWKTFSKELSMDESLTDTVATMILATQKHQIMKMTERDSEVAQAYFLDLDMAVLGKTTTAYLAYASLIRKEYSFVDHDVYCSKRAEILQTFLKKTIYQTAVFQKAMEERARTNLQVEIDLLQKGVIPPGKIPHSKKDDDNPDSLVYTEVASHDHANVSLCQALRLQVFVEEQGIPIDVELDGKDNSPLTIHVMVRSSLGIVGTGRIVISCRAGDDDPPQTTASLGRIAIAKRWRRRGIGKKIVQQLENIARQRSVHRLQLTPHHYLERFYENLGFLLVESGESVVNDGCQLITMEKHLDNPAATPKNTNGAIGRPKRICLFGTSANPPTGSGGHVGVVQALLDLSHPKEEGPLFDEIRVLPVYRHTFANKRQLLASFEHRVAMCELAFLELSKDKRVVVSQAEKRSFERKSSGIEDQEELADLQVGTADLLEMLLEETVVEPTEFYFCLGADTFMDLSAWKWKRSKDVLRLLQGRLVVVHRKGMVQGEKELLKRIKDMNETEGGQIMVMDVPMLADVSSSKARSLTSKEMLQQLLPHKVADYIVSHNLYSFANLGECL